MPFQFITAIPLNVWKGSGCFMGIDTLATGIRTLGGEVNFVTPGFRFPFYAAKRTLFNDMLRYREFSHSDTIVGFDADGYSIAGRRPSQHVASIKGVIADVLPYETGPTRVSLAYQAHLEKVHAQRADLVITPSRYCAERLDELYHVRNALVIPELIDLDSWRDLLRENPACTSVEPTLHRAMRVPFLFSKAHSCAAARRGPPPNASSRIGGAHRRRRTRGRPTAGLVEKVTPRGHSALDW